MIACRDECNPELLADLLHSRLDIGKELVVTSHLEKCDECRCTLEQLTAPEHWWQDTQRLLKDSSTLGSLDNVSNRSRVDESVAWVVKLLKPPKDDRSIGTLDGRSVREVIGQGGMGVVLKVWDEELHRPLAVKLLSPMLASNGAARQRFYREAQAAASVVHPNIVPIYTVAKEGVLPYLVMPYVAGGNLQQRLDQQGPLPLNEILSIGVQIAEALVAAHRLGLVHRDIKPANILLDEGGHRVLLTDFGLARTIDDATITNSGMVAGTPQYMSPEQARGAQVDHRSDLYSLGAVLYAMATGRPPVRGDSTLAILRLVGEEQPEPIYEINETLPLWLDRLILRFLEKQVDHRISHASQAVELLRGSFAHVRSPAHNALPSELQNPPSSTHKWLVGAIGVMLISLIAGACFFTNTTFGPGVKSQSADMSNATNRVSPPMALAPIPNSAPDELSFDSDIPMRLQSIETQLQNLWTSLHSGTEVSNVSQPTQQPILPQ